VPKLPYIPGLDAAGVIEQVGGEVTKYQVGDRVYTIRTNTGTYAEYCTARPECFIRRRLSFGYTLLYGLSSSSYQVSRNVYLSIKTKY